MTRGCPHSDRLSSAPCSRAFASTQDLLGRALGVMRGVLRKLEIHRLVGHSKLDVKSHIRRMAIEKDDV